MTWHQSLSISNFFFLRTKKAVYSQTKNDPTHFKVGTLLNQFWAYMELILVGSSIKLRPQQQVVYQKPVEWEHLDS